MGMVTANMSMSLDGFIAGPHGRPGNPLGDGGARIQEWMFSLATFNQMQGRAGGDTNEDDEVLRERVAQVGAVVMGRGMFDEGEDPWGEEPPFPAPVFVVTRRARDPLERKGGTTFTFVTDGIESAVEQARAAAGDKNVNVAGGASAVQQAVKAGLLDQLQIHLTPILFGAGVRLFENLGQDGVELEIKRVVDSPAMTHLLYRVVK